MTKIVNNSGTVSNNVNNALKDVKKETSKKVPTKKVSGKKEPKIDLSKLTNEQLAEINLDDINLFDLVSNNKNLKVKLTAKSDKKSNLYKRDAQKSNESDKNFRARIRRERNNLLNKITLALDLKSQKDLDLAADELDKFYKDNYLVNDYSLNSLGRLNSDKDTLAKINIAFSYLRNRKTKKVTKRTPKKVTAK